MKLSPAQVKALEIAHHAGGVIQRYPGGFWAGPGIAYSKDSAFFPAPNVPIHTVRGLVTRGLLELVPGGESWRGPYRLTDEGRAQL